ncbi:MAG: hypothetical protein GWM90_05705, partial [Gemmatimonadetes bacterium]|nr:hypothetical protein [Gemmatimonadota bacterium]NIQ53264.1 hypothetical protein [Gemmatimonadota bacterium]NIU73403.1 hypothetical protein [Gammaproteobacteria bacterium]NIX43630.1 hypothetical protein [Gemmatimonadota bacterium]NIY07825.1 hypothetical protein [Gemmatimonadota bacterium]
LYYLVIGLLLAGGTLFWRTLSLYSGQGDTLATTLGLGVVNPAVGFLLSPAILLAGLAISAGVIHVLLLLFGGARHGFGATVRVFCYAYSPALFGLV